MLNKTLVNLLLLSLPLAGSMALYAKTADKVKEPVNLAQNTGNTAPTIEKGVQNTGTNNDGKKDSGDDWKTQPVTDSGDDKIYNSYVTEVNDYQHRKHDPNADSVPIIEDFNDSRNYRSN